MNTKKKKLNSVTKHAAFLEQLKTKVHQAQLKASLAVNSELIQLYWDIGKAIVEKEKKEQVITQVTEESFKHLQHAFPEIQGFSHANILKIKAFYLTYAEFSANNELNNNLPIIKIPWGYNVLIFTKIKDPQECLWYAKQTVENGLSKAALNDLIKSAAYERSGNSTVNSVNQMPEIQSELAQKILEDPDSSDLLTFHLGYQKLESEEKFRSPLKIGRWLFILIWAILFFNPKLFHFFTNSCKPYAISHILPIFMVIMLSILIIHLFLFGRRMGLSIGRMLRLDCDWA